MKSRGVLALLVFVLVAVLVGACAKPSLTPTPTPTSTGTPVSGPQYGGTLIFGNSTDVGGLDPMVFILGVSHIVLDNIYDSLVQADWEYKVYGFDEPQPRMVPGLAESWEWEGSTLVFHLRKGVKFHDGTSFSAPDVLFNFRRYWDKNFEFYYPQAAGFASILTKFIEDIQVRDNYTVAFKLTHKNWNFLDTMKSIGYWAIISPTAIRTYGNPALSTTYAVGTGPFKLANFTPGVSVELEANNDYWGGRPYLDKVIYRTIPDGSARVAALLAGEVDIINEVPTDLMDRVRQSPGKVLYTRGRSGVFMLPVNHAEPPFNNPLVRKAVSLAIDREALARDLLKGGALPAGQFSGPGDSTYDPSLFPPDRYDPEEAKRLLAAAGYPNGFETKLFTSATGMVFPAVPLSEAIQAQLREVGVNVKIELMDINALIVKYWSAGMPKGQNEGLIGLGAGLDTPYGFDLYHRTELLVPNGWGIAWYSNPAVDELLQQADQGATFDDYVKLHKEAQRVAKEDNAYIYVLHALDPYGVADRVKNWQPQRSWTQRFNNLWLE